MVVKKLSSKNMFYSRLLSDMADEVRRNAQQKVEEAESEKSRSLRILSRTEEVLEKVQRVVENSRSERERRKSAAESRKQRKR